MSGEMEVYDGGNVPDIFVARDPVLVIEEARKAAKVLVSVVSQKPRKVMMNNEQYLEFEDWMTVAKFYGCTVKVRNTNFLDLGGVKGFEATADVLDRDGRVISSADAMCLNDEEKWSTRPKYEWKDKLDAEGKKIWNKTKNKYEGERIKIGEDQVPLFQLRSMAQTRACAKAFRNVFSWVVVLAGYRPTPAEEMDGLAQTQEGKPPLQPPQEKAGEGEKKDGGSTAEGESHISQKEGNMLFAKFKGKGVQSGALMNTAVRAWYQDDNLELYKLPAKHLDDCIKKIDALPDPEKK